MTGTIYFPQPGVFVGRPPCMECGAAYRLHHETADRGVRRCPQAYRPDTLEAAQRALSAARDSGDAAALFIARGEVQRLGGNPDE